MNKTLKKILGVSALTAFAVAPVSAASFSDTANHWVAEYLDTAIEAGVIDGSKANFLPEADISRAALTKMVVNYDNGGENPTATSYETAATFSDVSADAWYYHHVSYAAENGIIDGSKATFNPGTAITRAAALKVITVALGVPSDSTKALPFADVNEGDWYYSYVNDAYNNCIIKDAANFNPGAPITRAAATKILVKSLNPGCEAPVVPTEPTEPTEPVVDPTDPTVVVPVSTNTVEVVVNNSVSIADIPKGGNDIEILAFDVTAGSAEDVKLTNATVYHTGNGDVADLGDVELFVNNAPKGNDDKFDADDYDATINLTGAESIVIPAGTTKTIFVKIDVDANARLVAHGAQILSADDLTFYGVSTGGKVSVAGSFPIAGPQRTVADFSVGAVAVSYESVADAELEVGTEAGELAKIKVEASDEEDVWLKTLTVEIKGTSAGASASAANLDDGDIANLFVEVNGVVVSDVIASASDDKVTFNLTAADARGVLVEDGESEKLSIKGTLTSKIEDFNKDFVISIDESSDFYVVGARHGFSVSVFNTDPDGTAFNADDSFVKNTLSTQEVTIEGGDFVFDIDGEISDIAADTDDVVFGTVTFENNGAAVQITEGFKLLVAESTVGTIEKVKLVDAAGQTIFGTDNVSSGAVIFDDEFVVPTGLTTLTIQADVVKAALDDATVQFSLDNSVNAPLVEGGADLDDASAVDVRSATSTPAGKIYTVKRAGVEKISQESVQADTVVEGADDIIVWNGVIEANSAEDITVTELKFEDTTGNTAVSDDIDSFALSVKYAGDTEFTVVDSNVSVSGATATDLAAVVTKNFVVAKGTEVEVRLTASVSSTSGGKVVAVKLVSADLEDEEGDDIVQASPAVVAGVATVSIDGATITVVAAGTLEVTLKTSETADSALLLAGNDEAYPVATFEFDTDKEGVKVKDITFDVVATAPVAGPAQSVKSLGLFYSDTGVAVLGENGNAVETSVDKTTGKAEFKDVNFIVEDSNVSTLIEVRAMISDIDDSQEATGVSGEVFTVALAANTESEIVGLDSGDDLALTSADFQGTSAAFTVANNAVVATIDASQDVNLGGGTEEAIKFTLTAKGDNEAKLEKVSFVSNFSGLVAADVKFKGLKIDGELVATDVGIDTVIVSGTGVDITITNPEVIKTAGSIIVIEIASTIDSAANNSNLTTTININGAASGSDDITWKDYGDDDNGASIQWIDLGSDKGTTRLSNTLSN